MNTCLRRCVAYETGDFTDAGHRPGRAEDIQRTGHDSCGEVWLYVEGCYEGDDLTTSRGILAIQLFLVSADAKYEFLHGSSSN